VAVHHRRFMLGIAIGAVAAGALLFNFHRDLAQFTTSVTVAIDLMAVCLLGIYFVERRHPPEPALEAPELATGV